jgi:hypothetical protein
MAQPSEIDVVSKQLSFRASFSQDEVLTFCALEEMLFCKYLAVQIVFSILFLSSTGNDNKSSSSEHAFVSSLATKTNIVSDAIQGQSELQNSITDSFAGSCPLLYFNTSKQCFPILKKNNCSFELYNLTEETKEQIVTAERETLRLFGTF